MPGIAAPAVRPSYRPALLRSRLSRSRIPAHYQAGKPSVGELLRRGHQLAPGVQDAGADPGLRPEYEPRRPRHFIWLACAPFGARFFLSADAVGTVRWRAIE